MIIDEYELDQIIKRHKKVDQLIASMILFGLKDGAAALQAVSRDIDRLILSEQVRIERRKVRWETAGTVYVPDSSEVRS